MRSRALVLFFVKRLLIELFLQASEDCITLLQWDQENDTKTFHFWVFLIRKSSYKASVVFCPYQHYLCTYQAQKGDHYMFKFELPLLLNV